MSDGRRVARMEKEVHHAVAQFLISGYRCPMNSIITVTRVIMPGDLRSAKIYVSILLQQDESVAVENASIPEVLNIVSKKDSKSKVTPVQSVLDDLQSHAADFQGHISRNLKSRFCPKLKFFEDEASEHVLKVERLLRDIKKNEL